MRVVRIHQAAAEEAVEAAAWYELQRAMRLVLKRFPYDIVVFDQQREILVLAVAHQPRRPGYWRGRRRA